MSLGSTAAYLLVDEWFIVLMETGGSANAAGSIDPARGSAVSCVEYGLEKVACQKLAGWDMSDAVVCALRLTTYKDGYKDVCCKGCLHH